ncbi:MAG: 23S rRNA (guanosine(2251)-2'-O)-methyltransferase RlmB [Cellvibrionaceae bacterium]|nr:23S rRNA (guanosine(2251)-2'-O)-methyltransferase RlmB [Cellvibrionaceae bacterium]
MAKLETVFGLHAVQALLKSSPHRVTELWVLKNRNDQRLQKVLAAAEKLSLPVQQVSRKALDDKVDGNHQGVIALAKPGQVHDEKYLQTLVEGLQQPAFLLVLDGVTDPHNLGACLRSAEAAGVQAVIAPKDNSASLNETARKVACGAAEVLPYICVTNLARSLKWLQQQGVWTIGTAGEAEQGLHQADLSGPMALVMGAEGKGMRRLTRECCDSLINIPMAGEVSSLNVSVATGVCLFEAVRQRQ